MRLGERICIIPFNSRNRDSDDSPEDENAANSNVPSRKRWLPKTSTTRSKKQRTSQEKDGDGRRRKTKLARRSEMSSRTSNGDGDGEFGSTRDHPDGPGDGDGEGAVSDRITFSRFVEIFKEAYITTMSSFANKPGGLGGMTMGGKIDLPDATPSRAFKEPRDFVRSWSKRRPDYISSPAPEYVAKGPERDFAQRTFRLQPSY